MASGAPTGVRGTGDDRRRLTLAFFFLHPGLVRFYGSTLRLLAQRGHLVHLLFVWPEKDPGDKVLLDRLLADEPAITADRAPLRPGSDGWRAIALLTRSLTDLARYADPRYADASALRDRIRARFLLLVAEAPSLNGPVRRACRALITFVSAPKSRARARTAARALAAVERAIPTAAPIDAFLAGQRPDAVVASPVIDFASSLVDPLKSARRLGIPSGVAVASWDNLTGKGLLRVVPDRVFVWNETQADEAANMHGIPRDRAVVTGAPKFDSWFDRRPSRSGEAFAAEVGLPGPGYVLYVCSSSFIAPDEAVFVREWLERLRRADAPVRSLPVLVRPHPQHARQWEGVDLSDLGPVAIWPPHGQQPDDEQAREGFFDSLAYASAVVGVNTSAMIEAAIASKPVLTVLVPRYAGTQEGTIHFHYLLHEHGGFLHVGRTLDEHVAQLADALSAGGERSDRFVDAFVRPLGRDVAATPRLADAIEELARSRPLDAAAPSPATRLLRAALAPVAFAAGLRSRGRGDAGPPAALAD